MKSPLLPYPLTLPLTLPLPLPLPIALHLLCIPSTFFTVPLLKTVPDSLLNDHYLTNNSIFYSYCAVIVLKKYQKKK